LAWGADPLTPSGGPQSTARPVASAEVAISFDDAIRAVGSVFPVRIDRFDQLIQNSYNWTGPSDASLFAEVGFAPQAIVIQGRVIDDQPFVQPYSSPYMPQWWTMQYAADGVEMRIDDPTSSTNGIHLILNFGSAGTRPRIQIINAPLMPKGGDLPESDFTIKEMTATDTNSTAPANAVNSARQTGFAFQAAIPTTNIVEPRFFSNSLRISVRLHDLDGDFKTYCVMEDVIEKKE
jgi:hypothetical protein